MSRPIILSQFGHRLIIAPGCGGTILRYYTRRNGKKIHWFHNEIPSFSLAPFCNRIRAASFTFAAKQFVLRPNAPPHSLHGSAWQGIWQVKEKTANSCAICYQQTADEGFPYSYSITQAFTLTESLLSVRLILTNRGKATMPFGFGLHPYFRCDSDTIVQARTGAIWLTDSSLMPTRLVRSSMVKRLSQGLKPARVKLDNTFTDWQRKALIDWPQQGRRLEISATSPLDYLCVYSPGDGSFCVEPVSNVPDAFNLMARGQSNHGSLILAPNQTARARVNFRPLMDLSKG